MDLYNRYADDQAISMRISEKGWRFNSDKDIMKYSKDKEILVMNYNPTEKTAREISNTAKGLEEWIRVTCDCQRITQIKEFQS